MDTTHYERLRDIKRNVTTIFYDIYAFQTYIRDMKVSNPTLDNAINNLQEAIGDFIVAYSESTKR